MKKFLSLVLALALVLCASLAAADEVQLYSSMTEADLDALITCFNEV